MLSNVWRHGTNIFVIILSITSTSGISQLQVQQRYNGMCVQVKNIRRDGWVLDMCPFSKQVSNKEMIIFGSGTCDIFFDANILLRDNGAILDYFFKNIF